MNYKTHKEFANGRLYLIHTDDGYPVEVTDTHLPYYTKDAIGRHQNSLTSSDLGSRSERWMIGVSTMSGCPVHCGFCATGQLKRWRNLTATEIYEQVAYAIAENPARAVPGDSQEFKINMTRMGEPFLNLENVRKACQLIHASWPFAHIFISTIGLKQNGQMPDFSWIKDNITLQISLHSLRDDARNKLIPVSNKLSIEQLGKIRTNSKLKTTINLTLVDPKDFDIDLLKRYFDPKHFFIKISPLNPNPVSEKNLLEGVIQATNLV